MGKGTAGGGRDGWFCSLERDWLPQPKKKKNYTTTHACPCVAVKSHHHGLLAVPFPKPSLCLTRNQTRDWKIAPIEKLTATFLLLLRFRDRRRL